MKKYRGDVMKNIVKKSRYKLKNAFFKTLKFFTDYFSIILFSVLSLGFLIALITLVYFDKMSEVDTALKYVLVPVYIFSAIISGNLATRKIKNRILVVLKHEPESRWATKSEIIKNDSIEMLNIEDEEFNAGGMPFIVEDDKVFIDNSEAHSLIFGSTGSGKTRRLVFPLLNILSRAKESIVVTDPKGELYYNTKELFKSKGYNVISINFLEPHKGNAWNPLEIPYKLYLSGNKDKAIEMIYDLGMNIFVDDTNKNQDPFWEYSASNYFSGLVLALFEDAEEKEINLNSVINMNSIGKEKIGANTYIQEYFRAKEKTKISFTSASGTINAPNDTRNSILSVFEQKLTIYSSKEALSKMLSYSDFSMKDIGMKHTIVYIIMHDEKSTYHPLVSAFIKQCYEMLIEVALENKGKLPVRTNFVLDEFANLPPITDMDNMVTAARSRNIRLNLIVQSAEQLKAQYGQETAEVIKGNCSNWFFLISKELQLLKDLSELCGHTEERVGLNEFKEKPLISVSQLQRLKIGEVLIKKDREHPFRTYLPDISQYDNWYKDGMKYSDDIPIERFDVKTFDIKAFVDEIKERKREEIFRQSNNLANESIPSPFSNSFDFGDNHIDKIPSIDVQNSHIDNSIQKDNKEKKKKKHKKKSDKEKTNKNKDTDSKKWLNNYLIKIRRKIRTHHL